MTTTEVARRFGTARSTITRKATAGEIPHVLKFPHERGAYMFDRDVIEQLAAKREAAKRK